jgi:type IX secretion system PorP/SprF family membrane protein
MKKNLHIVSILALLFFGNARPSYGQDPEFTQFYANPLYLNPAFAGTANGPRFVMNYRNQWASISSGGFVTYAASYDQHFDALGGGIGIQVYHDRAGDAELTATQFSFIYSYHLNVSRKFTIKAGLQAATHTKSIDFSKLRFGDQIHPRLGFIYQTQENLPSDEVYKIDPFLDFSAGVMGFTDKFYGGFAVHHLNKPQQSFFNDPTSILPMKYTTHLGMIIPLENVRHPKKFISPNVMYQKQENFAQINFGAYYLKDNFLFGAWFRQTSENSDALMALIGMKKDPIKIGYSYDVTFSDARYGAKGSHEVSLIIEFKTYKRPPSVKWRKLNCPDF